MYCKISHWSSLGLFKILTDIRKDSLQRVAMSDNIPDLDRDPKMEDPSLSYFLCTIDDESIRFLTAWPESETVIPRPNLHGLQNVARQSKVIYRKEMVVDFHFFLIRLLFGYAYMLAMLADSYGYPDDKIPVEEEITNIKNTVLQFIPFAHALYNVVHSKSFYRHIELLNKTEGVGLLLPTFGNVGAYREFGWNNKILLRKVNLEKGAGRCDNGIEEEFASLGNTGNTFTEDGVFRRWILAFVTHFTAKCILEKHVANVPTSVDLDICLLSVQHPLVPPPSWDDMKMAISDAVKTGNTACDPRSKAPQLQVDETLNLFTNCIKDRLAIAQKCIPWPSSCLPDVPDNKRPSKWATCELTQAHHS